MGSAARMVFRARVTVAAAAARASGCPGVTLKSPAQGPACSDSDMVKMITTRLLTGKTEPGAAPVGFELHGQPDRGSECHAAAPARARAQAKRRSMYC
jgi:hypothetical protein